MSEPLDRQAGTPRWAFAAAVVLLVVVIFFVAGLADRLPLNVWRERLREAGTGGVLLFLVAGVAGTSIGLPRQLLAGVGGYAYGIASGLILSLVAAIGGCALTVLIARWVLSERVERRFARQVQWLQRVTRDDTFLKIVVLRLQPLGTNLATNVSAGVIRLPVLTFLGASVLGYIPQMLVFALAGSGIAVGSRIELGLAIALFVVSLLLAGYLWKRHQLVTRGP